MVPRHGIVDASGMLGKIAVGTEVEAATEEAEAIGTTSGTIATDVTTHQDAVQWRTRWWLRNRGRRARRNSRR